MKEKVNKKNETTDPEVLKQLFAQKSIEGYEARAERLACRADESIKRALKILQEAASE